MVLIVVVVVVLIVVVVAVLWCSLSILKEGRGKFVGVENVQCMPIIYKQKNGTSSVEIPYTLSTLLVTGGRWSFRRSVTLNPPPPPSPPPPSPSLEDDDKDDEEGEEDKDDDLPALI